MSTGVPSKRKLLDDQSNLNHSNCGKFDDETIRRSTINSTSKIPKTLEDKFMPRKISKHNISMTLGHSKSTKLSSPAEKKKKVADIFCQDNSDSEEEIPAEAKMRMKNLGKDTPTSAGPNSFNKGRGGFSDVRKVQQKKIQDLIKCDLEGK